MVLRLAAGVPMVWRTPHSIQLGVQRPVLVLDDVSPPFERMLAALAAGVSPSGWQMLAAAAGLGRDEAAALLEQIAPALEPQPVGARPSARVVGDSPLGREIAA